MSKAPDNASGAGMETRDVALALIRHYWLDSAHQPDERYVAAVQAAHAQKDAELQRLRDSAERMRDAALKVMEQPDKLFELGTADWSPLHAALKNLAAALKP